MTYDQRRIYLTTVGLVALALGVLLLVQGSVGPGVLLVVIGLALAVGALSGRALGQRDDDTSDPRNHR